MSPAYTPEQIDQKIEKFRSAVRRYYQTNEGEKEVVDMLIELHRLGVNPVYTLDIFVTTRHEVLGPKEEE